MTKRKPAATSKASLRFDPPRTRMSSTAGMAASVQGYNGQDEKDGQREPGRTGWGHARSRPRTQGARAGKRRPDGIFTDQEQRHFPRQDLPWPQREGDQKRQVVGVVKIPDDQGKAEDERYELHIKTPRSKVRSPCPNSA